MKLTLIFIENDAWLKRKKVSSFDSDVTFWTHHIIKKNYLDWSCIYQVTAPPQMMNETLIKKNSPPCILHIYSFEFIPGQSTSEIPFDIVWSCTILFLAL